MVASDKSKAKLKSKLRDKKKRRKERIKERRSESSSRTLIDVDKLREEDQEVQIEYVPAAEFIDGDPNMAEFERIFKHFQPIEETTEEEAAVKKNEEDEEDEEESKPRKSNKQKKKERRVTVSQLKGQVKRPEKVDVHDANSTEPVFLIWLKSYKNAVPVPAHWTSKRRYLQGKRGIEKVAFELPDYIQATGISKIRQAMLERDASKRLKSKGKDHMAPKMGQLDLDYQVLHDAFFRFQTKPYLSPYGDVYYENKEYEVHSKSKKPGHISTELKKALGMPDGAPPPWLLNMQRHGPPPSYPNLRIPGLNAPIPDGAQYGFHPGAWGKPPVDEYGRPIYGDVFNQSQSTTQEAPKIERRKWGEVLQEEYEEYSESSASSSDESEAMEEEKDETGIESVPQGLETPDTLQLAKEKPAVDYSDKYLYKVLEQKDASVGKGLMGTTHTYAVGEEISLNPAEVEQMNDSLLKKKVEGTAKSSKDEKKYNYKF